MENIIIAWQSQNTKVRSTLLPRRLGQMFCRDMTRSRAALHIPTHAWPVQNSYRMDLLETSAYYNYMLVKEKKS